MVDRRILKYILLMFIIFCTAMPAASAEKIRVEPGESIQSAIDLAAPGDVIEVASGEYDESLNVNKQLSLIGVDTGNGAPTVNLVRIVADNCEFKGFKVYNSELFAIAVNSNWNKITDNKVETCIDSIILKDVHDNFVARNEARIICQGRDVLSLLSGNGGDGIHLINSHNNTIRDNSAANGFIGIYLDHSDYNLVEGNNATGNSNGIGSYTSVGNTIKDNVIRKNAVDGIGFLRFSNDSVITGNLVESNGHCGIFLQDSSHNTIYLNKLIRNNENAQSKDYRSAGSVNLWRSAESVTYLQGNKNITGYLGNYWSDYLGKDLNDDNIGDESYRFNGGQDSYPLMKPVIKGKSEPAQDRLLD
jgi:nitrous oxidase accessory protein